MPEIDDDMITVSFADDGEGTVTKVDPDKPVKKVETDDPLADLKGQFESMKGRTAHLEQQNQHLSQQLSTKDQELAATRKEVVTTQLDTVAAGIQAADAEATAAERDFVAAAEAGDFAAQARAQRKMAAAEAKKLTLQQAKGDLEDDTKVVTTRKEAPEQRTTQDPVAAFTANMAPRAAAWVRSHPECVTDRGQNAKMMATHYAALAEGLTEGSDEYFDKLDGMFTAKKTEAKAETKETSGRRPSSAAASGSGNGGGMNGGGNEVRLTKREAEAATDGSLVWNWDDTSGKNRFKKGDPIGINEFARRKAQMVKDGHYDRSYDQG